MNKKYETNFQFKNTFVHYSTYKVNPFISKEFLSEVEATRERNPRRSEWLSNGRQARIIGKRKGIEAVEIKLVNK